MTKSLGEGAWDVYANAVGQTTFDNKPLPGWAELGERQKEGWEAAAEAAKTLIPWQTRVLLEKEELDGKIARLKEFLVNPLCFLSDENRELMEKQLMAMEQYTNVLAERVDGF